MAPPAHLDGGSSEGFLPGQLTLCFHVPFQKHVALRLLTQRERLGYKPEGDAECESLEMCILSSFHWRNFKTPFRTCSSP